MLYWTWIVEAYLDQKITSIAIQMPQGPATNRTLTQKLRQLTGKPYTIHSYQLQG